MQNSFSYFFSSSGWSETESTQYMIHNRQDNVDVIKYCTLFYNILSPSGELCISSFTSFTDFLPPANPKK